MSHLPRFAIIGIFLIVIFFTLAGRSSAELTPPPAVPAATPVASSFSTAVPANRQSAITLLGSDSDGTALTYATTSTPAHGTLSDLNTSTGTVVYTPVTNYTGADSFTYTVTSGGQTSPAGTVTLTVSNAKTRIIDSIVDLSGAPRRGKVTFILTQPVTTPTGISPVGASVSATLNSNGVFDISVYPSKLLSPNAYYQVWYADGANLNRELIGIYEVPLSTTAIVLAPYKVTDTNLAARYTFVSTAAITALQNSLALTILEDAGNVVQTFNGRTGAVVPATNDYTWSQISKTGSSLADLSTRSASDLSSGTLLDARFPSTLPAVSGANLTGVLKPGNNLSDVTDAPTARTNLGLGNIVSGFHSRTGAVTLQSSDLNGLSGAGLTGIGAGTGGVINTGSTTIGADSDANDSGTVSIQVKNVEKLGVRNDGQILVGGLPNVFNVASFGAACDWNGTSGTDDTVAITAAKDAAEAAGNGAILFFPGPCMMRKLTAGGELLMIRKALIFQGVNKNWSGIFASTDTPSSVQGVVVHPLGWPDTKGFTIRDMAITSAGRCEGNPLFGGCHSPGGGEWYQGPNISLGAALVFDTTGNANTYSIQGVLIENSSIGPTANGIAIYGTASSSNGTPAASEFNNLDLFGTVKWDDAGDSITFRGGRHIGPGYAHDVTMTGSATKYSILDPNITSDGGIIFHNGVSPQIIGGIVEIYKSWRSPAAYGGVNGAVIDFAGDLPGATVYQPLVLGTVVNSLSAASLNSVRFGTTQFGRADILHCDNPSGKVCVDNSATAANTLYGRNQQFGASTADAGKGRWNDPANRLQVSIAGFAGAPSVGSDQIGSLALIGSPRFTAPDTSSPARLQLNWTDANQSGQVQFQINNANAATIQMGGSTSARPNSLDFINITNSDQTWWTNNTRRLTLGNDGHWEPFVTATYNWGSTSKRWLNGYFTTLDAPTINATTGFTVSGSALNFSHLAGSLNFSSLAGTVTPAQEAAFTGASSFIMLPTNFTSTAPGSTPVGANNQVRVQRVYIDRRITLANLYFEVMTASAGGNCALAIYNAAGTTKLIDSGAISTTATGVKSAAVAVTLNKGFYWFAWTVDNTTAAFRGMAQSSTWTPILNAGTVHTGTAANSSAAGVMPATLGTITGVDGMNVPIAKLQG